MAGVSRSATIVAAYLIKKYRSSARYILALLQRKRRQIHPNAGFVKQLK
jgi:dual specificity phosphatase 12